MAMQHTSKMLSSQGQYWKAHVQHKWKMTGNYRRQSIYNTERGLHLRMFPSVVPDTVYAINISANKKPKIPRQCDL